MKYLRKIYNSTSNVHQLQGHRKIPRVNLSSPGSNLGTTPETSRKTVPRWPCSGFLSSFPALWHSWSLWVYLGDTQGKNSFSWCGNFDVISSRNKLIHKSLTSKKRESGIRWRHIHRLHNSIWINELSECAMYHWHTGILPNSWKSIPDFLLHSGENVGLLIS